MGVSEPVDEGVADELGVPLNVPLLVFVAEKLTVEEGVDVLLGEGSKVADWLGVLVTDGVLEGVPEGLGVALGVMVPVREGVRVEEKLTVGVKLGVLLALGSKKQEINTEPETPLPSAAVPPTAERRKEMFPERG